MAIPNLNPASTTNSNVLTVTGSASSVAATLPFGIYAGSDAFFPFCDGPQLLIDAGVKCIVQPRGSLRDQETIDICEAAKVTLLLTGERCFRH